MHTDTKQLIAQHLLAMLEHAPLESVSVKSLVDSCRISRQTFYYHFRDIFDVLEWDVNAAMEQCLTQSTGAAPKEEVRAFVQAFLLRRKAILRLLESSRRADFEHLLIRAARTYLWERLRRLQLARRLPAADLQALLDFHACGLVGLMLRRCEQGEIDAQLLTEQIYRLMTWIAENAHPAAGSPA